MLQKCHDVLVSLWKPKYQDTISEEKEQNFLETMKVIKSKFSSGKVAGAFATFDQFLWLPLGKSGVNLSRATIPADWVRDR